MFKKLLLSTALVLSTASAMAAFPSEQVWEATHTNNQQVCGINSASSNASGQILTKGESSTDGAKAIVFDLKSNTKNMSWKITEAKITDNAGRFDFNDNLLQVKDRNQSSLFVNNTEYDWERVGEEQSVDPKAKLRLAPKINLDATEFPLGQTKIQGKIVVTCSS